jgi:hypothetical protein
MADSAISGPTAGDRVRLTEIDPERSFINVRYQVPWSEAAANEVSAAEI